MLKNRRDAAVKVVDSLYAAEAAIDAALARAAELNTTLANARVEAKVSAVVGQDAFQGAAAAFAALARARADIVETHNRLEETRIRLGLRTLLTVGSGDNGGKEEPMAHERQRLHVVS